MAVLNTHLRTLVIVLIALVILKVSKFIAAPIALALVLGVILSPMAEAAAKWKIPGAVMAMVTSVVALALIVGMLIGFAPLVQEAISEVPAVIDAVRESLSGLLRVGEQIERVSKEVEEAIGAGSQTGSDGQALPTVIDAALVAPQIAAQALIFLGTLFFFMLTRDSIYEWVANTFSTPGKSEKVQRIIRSADRSVSRYFLTITAINFLLGCAVTAGVYFFGFASPPVWGLAAFLLNYLLYLGPMMFAVALLVVGHLMFSGIASFGPMAMFLMLNFLEGYLITPTFVGARLAINPLVIFLTLTLGLWLWGVVGGIVSLPVLVWILAAMGVIEWSGPKRKSDAPVGVW